MEAQAQIVPSIDRDAPAAARSIAAHPFPSVVHCVGVAGGGLSALARLLVARGHRVTGSDTGSVPASTVAAGVRVASSHAASHLGDAQLIVRSVAVPDDNPEIVAARRRGLPVIKYSEALGRLMAGRRGVAVAGTHGKTTTTALLGHLLAGAGADPAWIVGGDPVGHDAARWGHGPFVVEACEYDHSFLNLDYEVAIVSSIAPDHLDCFGDAAGVTSAFRRFASRLPAGGTLVLGPGIDAAALGELPPGVQLRAIDGALSLPRVSESAQGFAGVLDAGPDGRGEFSLTMLGRHNLDNLRLAVAAGLALGLPLASLLPHVATFGGVARRLQDLGEVAVRPDARVRLVDDFAHHPDALRAAAAALRARFPGRRLVGVFQPHQISRTEDLMEAFAAACCDFDIVALCDIFVARDRHPERAADVLAELLARGGPSILGVGPARKAAATIRGLLQSGDVCVLMGAGDVSRLAPELALQPASEPGRAARP